MSYHCKRCDAKKGVAEIPALGHKWGERLYTAEFENTAFETQTKTEKIPAKSDYNIITGNDQTWTKGSGNTAVFVFKSTKDDSKTFELFRGIKVDGKDVESRYYTAEAGSVILTLKAEYLETLAIGKHTLTAVFADGSADAEFTVRAAQNGGGSSGGKTNNGGKGTSNAAKTGDENPMTLYLALLFISMAAAGGVIGVRRRKQRK